MNAESCPSEKPLRQQVGALFISADPFFSSRHEHLVALLAFRDPRGWNETPPWLPEHQTLVFADAPTERAGVLRVWMSPTHEDRALPDLRAMLDLPFERVIISHGEPVHMRDAFKRALELPQGPAGPLH